MAQVVVLDQINQDLFVCGTCKTIYNSLEIFVNHKRIQCLKDAPNLNQKDSSAAWDSQNKEKCYSNETVQTTCRDLKSSEMKNFSCELCKRQFKKLKSLQLHMRSHTENPYQCPICGRCFIQNSHVQRHLISHKVWPDGLSETTVKTPKVELLSYSCSYCQLILTNYSQFRAHLKNHLTLKKFKCIQHTCNMFFDVIEDLLHHVSIEHIPPEFVCHICNKTFHCLEEIACHHQSHNESDKPEIKKHFKCQYCDAVFRKSEKLSLHMLTENHKKTCIHCNKVFASDKRLRLHLQIHRKQKPFRCNICGMKFHMKKYLSSHVLKHGESQFLCTLCNLTFKRKDLLKRHMRIHQIKSILKCPFKETLDCKKEFSRSDKLKSHIKNHAKSMAIQRMPKIEKEKHDVGTVEICILDTSKV